MAVDLGYGQKLKIGHEFTGLIHRVSQQLCFNSRQVFLKGKGTGWIGRGRVKQRDLMAYYVPFSNALQALW